MSLDFSRCRLPPFQHQLEDVPWLMEHPYAFIMSEMRTGKTKIVIDAAQFMYEQETIDTVIVVSPSPVRDVWANEDLGEVAKHAWQSMTNRVIEYHAKLRTWIHPNPLEVGKTTFTLKNGLTWFVTNFEFLRSKARLEELLPYCGPKTLLVVDESSFVKNHSSQQTKACMKLRWLHPELGVPRCGRIVLLNGTPIFHSPKDLFSQCNLLHPSILDCPYITHFLARYATQTAVLGIGGKAITTPYGKVVQKISGWTKEGIEDLQRRLAPVSVRRLQKDCIDMPPKLEPVVLSAAMTPEEWSSYKQMRDELVVWLKSGQVAVSATAAIKALRLAQITSGFIGGIEEPGISDMKTGKLEEGLLDGLAEMIPGYTHDIDGFDWGAEPSKSVQVTKDPNGDLWFDELHFGSWDSAGSESPAGGPPSTADVSKLPRAETKWQTIGSAKLDALLWFLEQRLEADPNVKVVTWCMFRAELFRTLEAVKAKFPQFATAAIHGDQKREDRLRSLSMLKPETAPPGPVFAIGIEGTGSFGLDMTASHTCVSLSSGYSPGRTTQTLDRVVGPAQRHPIAYYDVIAVGPAGQRTIDHHIAAARRSGQDLAELTADAWVKILTKE